MSLADKEFIMSEEQGEPVRESRDGFGVEILREDAFKTKDLKEAIKKIKAQEIHGEDGFGREIMVVPVEEIDKIFGEELI